MKYGLGLFSFTLLALSAGAASETTTIIIPVERGQTVSLVETSLFNNINPDQAINEAVGKALYDSKKVDSSNINVSTLNGIVYLQGQVPSETDLVYAFNTANGISGVQGVVNELEVIKNNNYSTSENSIPDINITANVKSSLSEDPAIAEQDIDVDTKRGVVYLTGNVANEQTMVRANEQAEEVDGVRAVVNLLKVNEEANYWNYTY